MAKSLTNQKNLPSAFSAAIHSLMNIEVDKGINLREINPPTNISPFSLAVEATIDDKSNVDNTLGNFIVIYKESAKDTWGSPFRIVSHITSSLENEIAQEPSFRHHTWSKFCQEIIKSSAFNINGTVTISINQYFDFNDTLDNLDSNAVIDSTFDLRASWSAKNPDLKPHFLTWIKSFVNLTNSKMLF
ncbi:MAG: DUF3000 family protein [Bifidobacteriaceae bacterium]|jgi:hypothetical protein|nr:DUF3000 family protein [Bifidobacteriaceae bacterium]